MTDTVVSRDDLLTLDFQDGQNKGSISAARMRQLIVSLLPPETTLTYAANVTWNLDTNPVALITLTGNITITLIGGKSGVSYRLTVRQDNGGSRTIALSGATTVGAAAWNLTANSYSFMGIDFSNNVRFATITS